MTDERMSPDVRLREEEREAMVEATRVHLRLYTLAANVAGYVDPVENHDSVAARCAPLIVDDTLAPVVERIVAARVGEVVERVEAVASVLDKCYEQGDHNVGCPAGAGYFDLTADTIRETLAPYKATP